MFGGPPPDPVLQQHFHNVSRRYQQNPDDRTQSELYGELLAAHWMQGTWPAVLGGRPHPEKCLCGDELMETNSARGCDECQFRDPVPGTYRMVKGWGGGGKGMDQIWVKPFNWSAANPNNPPLEEIVIVEAKGGQAELSDADTYVGWYGSDGQLIDSGAQQLSENWVFALARQYATSAEKAPELKTVCGSILDAISGAQGAPKVMSVTLQNGKHVKDGCWSFGNDTAFTDPAQRGLILNALNNPASAVNIVPNTCNTASTALQNNITGFETVYRDTTHNLQDFKGVAHADPGDDFHLVDRAAVFTDLFNYLTNNGPAIAQSDPVLLTHLLNTYERACSLWENAANILQQQALQVIAPLYNPAALDLDATLKQIRKRVKRLLFTKMDELQGEIKAAIAVKNNAEMNGFKMIKGWNWGGTGLDQVWVRSATTPNFDPSATPWPADAEVMVVEAKGGKGDLVDAAVYVGEKLNDGTTLNGGCQQMRTNWIRVHAEKTAREAYSSPEAKKTAEMMAARLQGGGTPPAVFGVLIKNGTFGTQADYNAHGINSSVSPPHTTRFIAYP